MTGYESLMEAVKKDCNEREGCFNPYGCNHEFTRAIPAEGLMKKYGDFICKHTLKCTHKYCDTFKWAIDRAKQYGEKLGLNWEDVLNSWENDRSYWYMNYYQECNQPAIKSNNVRVFETMGEMLEAIGEKKFRCPCCRGISDDPYVCNLCGWKVYGLLRDLDKGVFVYCKDRLKGETIFMPLLWEKELLCLRGRK